MDGYAPAYVAHNIPLLVVSGLGPGREDDVQHKEGTRISSEIPTVESDDALALLRIFKDGDASDLAWNAREHSGRNKFRVKTVGRVLKPYQCIFVQALNLDRNTFYHHAALNYLLMLPPAQYRNLLYIPYYHH